MGTTGAGGGLTTGAGGGLTTGVGGGTPTGGEGTGIGGEGGGGVGIGGTNGLQLNELQSTGLDKNDLHCAALLCKGLEGKQFFLSSKSANPKQDGGSPVKKLYAYVKFSKFGS